MGAPIVQAAPVVATSRLRGRAGAARRAAFLRARPLCVECARAGRAEPATDVDHIVPLHRGGADDWRNLQPLCADHHRVKTAQERGGRAPQAIGPDGAPTDPGPHWVR